jgi:hypothetical protein
VIRKRDSLIAYTIKDSAIRDDKWEEQYAEFEAHAGMHASYSVLHNRQKTQLSKGRAGLNARIEKETAVNEGGAVWSNRKARLIDCITSKNASKST